tara:strand:+ start:520 stop:777 length:258 start_codon:yes stop_codon:yes gene_type:complete
VIYKKRVPSIAGKPYSFKLHNRPVRNEWHTIAYHQGQVWQLLIVRLHYNCSQLDGLARASQDGQTLQEAVKRALLNDDIIVQGGV